MKLSRTLYHTKGIRLRIHMYTTNENNKGQFEPFYRKFEFNGSEFMTIEIRSYFTLECTMGDWEQEKSIYLDTKGLPHIKREFKHMLSNFYNKPMFEVTKQDTPTISDEAVKEYTIPIYNLGYNQRMVIKPAVVYDENETAFEGVTILFNKSTNYVDLTIDEFESLVDVIKDLNLFVYSQLLANFFISYINSDNGKKELSSINKHIESINTSIFAKERESLLEKGVEETKPFKENPNDFFGIDKEN